MAEDQVVPEFNPQKEIEYRKELGKEIALAELQYKIKELENEKLQLEARLNKPKWVPKPKVKWKPDPIDLQYIHNLGKSIQNFQIRILFWVLYLTGSRITEALSVRISDLEERFVGDKSFWQLNMITLKNKKYKIRAVPLLNKSLYEQEMLSELHEYVKKAKEVGFDKMFENLTRFIAWHELVRLKIVTRGYKDGQWQEMEFKLHPHYLRHCRLSHLSGVYGVHSEDLMQFAGWSTPSPSREYINIGAINLYKKAMNV